MALEDEGFRYKLYFFGILYLSVLTRVLCQPAKVFRNVPRGYIGKESMNGSVSRV